VSATPNPVDEFVTFLQHQLPGLESGSYELDLDQHVDDATGKPISDDTIDRHYRFAVTGDRFRLHDPQGTIASCYPADNATGEYTTDLAHVVLNAPTLPWSRSVTISPPPLPAPGQDAATDVPTWLAVLVLDDDDAAAHPALLLDPVTRVVGDLFPSAAYGSTTLGTNYSYFDGAKDTRALEVDETTADPVQTIDLPLRLLIDIAPTLEDLQLNAHVRRLSVANKPAALGAQPSQDQLGTFGIVIGNRLPQPGKRSHAYLVSLEGLEGFLAAGDAGGSLRDGTLDLDRSLRVAVLLHWTFNTKGDPATFVAALKSLNGRTGDADAPNTNLRVAVDSAPVPIASALAGGYVPLDHHLRTGELTVSWYRGPLSPVDAEAAPIPLPISSADQALVFDPTTGLFDASLAAAWAIGRLMGLQDSAYASALYAFKRGLAQAVVNAAEQAIVADVLADLIALAPPDPSVAAATPTGRPLLDQAMRLLATRAP
jgi:hypothetical protein